MRAFWGSHQRFFKQLCVSLKVDELVRVVRGALAAGQSVVIGLQSTGEAALDRAVSSDEVLSAPISLCRAMVCAFIDGQFPTARQVDPALTKEAAKLTKQLEQARAASAHFRAAAAAATDAVAQAEYVASFQRAEANIPSIAAAHDMTHAELSKAEAEAGAPVEEAVRLKAEMLEEAEGLSLPACALDVILAELGGPACVAEMTGRKGRMVRNERGRWGYQPRAKPESGEMDNLNVSECKAFMEARKLVAIISDAASTGISLQADRRVANQRRRLHITLELAWSADKAVQQLGRSHRANQSSAPCYMLLTTDVGGEARFASAVARRLAAMGAITKGDRRAEIGPLDSFNFDTPFGKRALKALLAAVFEGGSPLLPGLGAADSTEATDQLAEAFALLGLADAKEREKLEVRKFLNRLLGLPLREQGLLFEHFTTGLDNVVSAAKRDGKYDEGMADISGSSVKLLEDEAPLWTDPVTGARTSVALVQSDRGVSFEAACAQLAESLAGSKAAEEAEEAGEEGVEGVEGRGDEADVGANGEAAGAAAVGMEEEGAGAAAVQQGGAGGGGEVEEEAAGEEDELVVEDEVVESESESEELEEEGGERGGFFRSKFKVDGKRRMWALLLPKANKQDWCRIVRPTTGPSPFDELWDEMLRKYTRVSEAEAREGWAEAFDGALHERGGGRLSTVQLLVGSTLPLLPTLESVVKAHAGELSKREQQISAVRVQMEARRLVGVRFPQRLMEPLRVALVRWQAERGGAGLKLQLDPPRPVDAKALAKAMKPPTTMMSFFGKSGAAAPAAANRPPPAPIPLAPAAAAAPIARAAAAVAASQGEGEVVDLTGDGDDRAMALALQNKFDQEAAAGTAAGLAAAKGRAAGGGLAAAKPPGRAKKGGVARGGGSSGGSGTAGAGEKRRSVLDMLGATPKRQA